MQDQSTGLVTFSVSSATINGVTYSLTNNPLPLVPPATNNGITSVQAQITAVPEPATMLLLGTGLAGVATALNTSYMAEQLAIFGIVVGVALLLSGIGFLILAAGGALRGAKGFVTVNEGIRSASWMENGASYTIDVECRDPAHDPRRTPAPRSEGATSLTRTGFSSYHHTRAKSHHRRRDARS